MVTTSVRMLYWVHSNTTHLRPAVTLGFVLVVGSACLEQRFVNTVTSSNNTDN